MCGWNFIESQGVVSLTFRELSKIFSRNLCIAEIVLVIRISSWNLVRVPKAMLWAHVQSFSLKFWSQMWFLVLCIFARLFWRARETLVKQPVPYINWSKAAHYCACRCIAYYSDVIMSTMASQITGVCIICSTVCLGAEQRKHQRKH